MQLPTEKEIREVGILIAKNILQTCKVIAQGKLKVLLEVNRPEWKDPNNRTRGIDQFAHTLAVTELYSKFGNGIEVYGEEEKKKPRTLAKVRKLVAFVDAIDGTDLLARGFANWVCAMVFFNPKENKIISAVIGHSSGDIYYASEKGAYVRPRNAQGKNQDRKLSRNADKSVELCDASLCFYGQKPNSFLRLARHQGFLQKMEELKEQMVDKKNISGKVTRKGQELAIRLYNFGGNPMMVKIPSGYVDAVFSLGGAEVHDVIPGAYIAVQSGAVFTDLAGNPIDPAECLRTPQEPVKYILSGSKALAGKLQQVLADPR